MNCRKCDKNVDDCVTKHITKNNRDPEKPFFHYRVKCKHCRKSYGIERNQEAYDLCKDKKWIWSKEYTKYKNNFTGGTTGGEVTITHQEELWKTSKFTAKN